MSDKIKGMLTIASEELPDSPPYFDTHDVCRPGNLCNEIGRVRICPHKCWLRSFHHPLQFQGHQNQRSLVIHLRRRPNGCQEAGLHPHLRARFLRRKIDVQRKSSFQIDPSASPEKRG